MTIPNTLLYNELPARLDTVISEMFGLTRSKSAKSIKSGLTQVNSIVVKRPSYIVIPKSRITIMNHSSRTIEIADIPKIHPIYHDRYIAVYNKPANILTHPSEGNTHSATLSDILTSTFPKALNVGNKTRPGIVHRLDKNTSGLILTALDQETYYILCEMIKSYAITRLYKALVHGNPNPSVGLVDSPIGRSKKTRTKKAVVHSGKKAQTFYRAIRKLGVFSLLEVKLYTGRTHQIRVHMSAIGHPVVGDTTYGGGFGILKNLKRHFLHAWYMEFDHPITNKPMQFTCQLPGELQESIEILDKL